MPLTAFASTITAIFNAVLDEKLAPIALEAIAKFAGAAGASYLRVNTVTRRVSSVVRWGGFAGREADYLARYGEIDPFRALQEQQACGTLVRVTESFPPAYLRHDEWYNDYLVAGGVRDLVGAKLHESSSHLVIVGVHRAVGDAGPFPRNEGALQSLMAPLQNAARLHIGLVEDGFRAASTVLGTSRPGAGVIVVDAQGRVIDANTTGERLLQSGDGFTIDKGKISARRSFETAKLYALIANAVGSSELQPSAGCMQIVRGTDYARYIVRVAPNSSVQGGNDLSQAFIFVSSPRYNDVSIEELSQLFGLTPRESGVALGLINGKRLSALVDQLGVQMPTLRTHVRSILRKCEVERQSDLMRLILSIPSADALPSDERLLPPPGNPTSLGYRCDRRGQAGR